MIDLDMQSATIDRVELPEFEQAGVQADVLRLDKIHAVVSGNKWFKLKYHLAEAGKMKASTILTFGGSWSNHIVATAWACKDMGFSSIGIIRGEEPNIYSDTLKTAASLGMKLVFVSRAEYDLLNAGSVNTEYASAHGIPADTYQVAAGGAGPLGVKGASEICALADLQIYSHIACSVGTSTMFAGLVIGCQQPQTVIGVPVLKGFQNIPEELTAMIRVVQNPASMHIVNDFHFGGYARKTPELIQFMNDLYNTNNIKTDFVYTGKLFYACRSLAIKNYFPENSRLLIIHSGGLQGNSSLPPGVLHF